MKRLLPLAPLPLLLLITMGIGPCDSKPLGSVDGCSYNGKTYATGITFKAADGCNSCTCQNGGAECTLIACSDAGIPTTDGSVATCFDTNGNLSVCPIKDAGTTVDGRPADAGVTEGGAVDAGSTCFDSSGKAIPCGGIDAGTSCTYNGKVYTVGASFTCSDGCNTCTCTASGVAGTTKGCPDSGTPTDGSSTCFDSTGTVIPCGSDGGSQCLYNNKAYPDGATFPDADGCNTCRCEGTVAVCTVKACVDSGTPTDGGTTTTTACSYEGVTYAVGSKFMCNTAPTCSTNICYCATPGQIVAMCSDEPLPVCGFDAAYVYGQIGGMTPYTDQVTLTPPSSYVLVRTVNPTGGGATGGSCGPALPACDSGPIDVNDIMGAIADPTVQLLISLSTMQTTLLGLDQRPVDGTIFSFKKSGTAGFLVGAPCNGASNCTEVPAAVSNLVAYLQKLDAQQAQDTSCAAFMSKL